jgi:aspartate/methionine/tyrosine aminotransferase
VRYMRMIMEAVSPEEIGYELVRYNLAESSMGDRTFDDLGVNLSGLVLCYGHHRGHPDLRELIAADAPGKLQADQVLISPGAAGALFTVATTVLNPSDHLIVVHPNYASNFETPRAIGCEISYLDLKFEDGWRLDLDRLDTLIRPNTKLISLTTPHNPTGVVLSDAEISRAIEIAERAGAWLLIDETYRELADRASAPMAVLSDRVISVSSISKTYGVPGLRIGWIINRDLALMEDLLAAKEQIVLAPSVVDEAIAIQLLRRRDQLLRGILDHARTGRAVMTEWIANEPRLE